jgi:hypothetical protein
VLDGGLIVRLPRAALQARVVTEHPTCDPGLSIFPWASQSQFCTPKADQNSVFSAIFSLGAGSAVDADARAILQLRSTARFIAGRL